jgi:3-oxoacyl-[acyl-carrier protein] reductase
MDLRINGRMALVAAASKGLGFAAARQLAAEGTKLSICSRDGEALEQAAHRLRDESGVEILATVADVTDADQTASWVESTVARFGRVDILVANGPGPAPGRFADLGDDDWRRACEQVLVTLARQVRLVLPPMLSQAWGRIAVINSVTARQPLDNLTLSNAVRAGIAGMVKTVSVEVASGGVAINSVLPGPSGTDRFLELVAANAARAGVGLDDVTGAMASDVPMGRLATPEEVGAVTAFLCSDIAGFITGSQLAVDGGAIRSI